jgi:GNAT superfamily N-acetyltransferase
MTLGGGMDGTLLRVAVPSDAEAIEALMKESTAALFPRYYDERQTASALQHIAVVDRVLLADGTYFVAEHGGAIIACGGWSMRDRLYNGAAASDHDGRLLDPSVEAARVRAMYTRAEWTRRGLGRRIIDECERAAGQQGFRRLELMATLPGVPLYLACGFPAGPHVQVTLADGVALAGMPMAKAISIARTSARA